MATNQDEEFFLNRPAGKAFDIPYKSPPAPANPVVRGLALQYLARIISSSSPIQNILWANAGLDQMRNRPELDHVSPRYESTVIKASSSSTAARIQHGSNGLQDEDWRSQRPSSKVYRSILDYHEAYTSGQVTPTAIVEALLPLVRRDVNQPAKHATAFLQSQTEAILKAAAESTTRFKDGKPRGPLDGVPVAVKDEEDVSGYRKCLGSKLDFSHPDDVTSYCVEQWLDAGAVLVGKTTMHELGLDTTNNNPNYGTPLNPHNDRYYCGGSSGGSAYCVSAGLTPVTMGNDGGGSIRIPAAYCGLYGLKPSQGRVSIRPTRNLAKSNGVAGPIAANMVDLDVAYRVMAQPDALDPESRLFVAPRASKELAGRKKVLGVFQAWVDRADAVVKKAFDEAMSYLTSQQGYETVDITVPMIHEGQVAHGMTILCEISSGISSVKDLTAANKVLISCGSKTPGVDLLQAQKMRHLLMQHLAYLYDKHPDMIIVTPTTPNAGWSFHPRDLAYGCSDGNFQLRTMEYVWLANFSGCPAISVPVGYADPVAGHGRVPIGLMGMGEWCSEDNLVAFGYDCETYLNDVVDGGRQKPANFVDVIKQARNVDGE